MKLIILVNLGFDSYGDGLAGRWTGVERPDAEYASDAEAAALIGALSPRGHRIIGVRERPSSSIYVEGRYIAGEE